MIKSTNQFKADLFSLIKKITVTDSKQNKHGAAVHEVKVDYALVIH
jgi:hypothetical protein